MECSSIFLEKIIKPAGQKLGFEVGFKNLTFAGS